jgi:hypothetical protein
VKGELYAPLLFANREKEKKFLASIPAFNSLLPHAFFYQTKRVLTNGGDCDVYPADVASWLAARGRISQAGNASRGQAPVDKTPAPIAVPTKILFNSAVETPFGMRFNTAKMDQGIVHNDYGDGTVLSEAIAVLCNDWKAAGHPVECLDVAIDNHTHRHTRLLAVEDVRTTIVGWLIQNRTEPGELRDDL